MNLKETLQGFLRRTWFRLGESWRYAIALFIIVRAFYFLWSWIIFTIQPVAIQNFVLADEPVVSIFSLKDNKAYVYRREVDGNILSFRPASLDFMVDQQTGTVWNISKGQGVQGQYDQLTLPSARVNAEDLFPYHDAMHYKWIGLSMWQRFDANWYLSIAEHGYGSIPGDDHFPPLFPLLIRLFTPIFGNPFLAGLFISHIATFFSIKLLYDTFAQWGEKAIGKRAVLFYVVYPTFFFYFSSYSESVFLLAALLSLQAMKERTWVWAGFWIFCATLTRLQGVALLAPMAFLMWRDHPFLQKPAHWAGPIVAGLGGLFYLYGRSLQVTGNAVPFVESEWHARIVPPWQTYAYAIQTLLSGKFTLIDFLNWAVVTLFIILLVWGWRKIPLEYNLYTALSLLIILIRIVETQPLISMSRYSLTLFPVFYALSLAGENPWIRRVILYTSILLALYLSAQFFVWGWVA